MQRYRLGTNLHLPGLDFRQVEDIVDQRQEVVARRLDRAGELDLLFGQVAVSIVAEQLGEDQRRVERRAQLVRHVGEKIRFVAAGLLQFRRLGLNDVLGARQFVLLCLKRLRLLFELVIGLFQLCLLLLKAHVRFFQRPALLLELLIIDAQLLGLRL